MKKWVFLITIFTFLLLLTGCSNNSKYLKEISLDKLYDMVEAKETFILELSQDGCSHCAVFNPRFTKILKEYKVYANYINCSKLTENELEKFEKDFNNKKPIGTPTVLFFVDGHEKTSMNRLSGEPSEKEIIRKLKQNDYIK